MHLCFGADKIHQLWVILGRCRGRIRGCACVDFNDLVQFCDCRHGPGQHHAQQVWLHLYRGHMLGEIHERPVEVSDYDREVYLLFASVYDSVLRSFDQRCHLFDSIFYGLLRQRSGVLIQLSRLVDIVNQLFGFDNCACLYHLEYEYIHDKKQGFSHCFV